MYVVCSTPRAQPRANHKVNAEKQKKEQNKDVQQDNSFNSTKETKLTVKQFEFKKSQINAKFLSFHQKLSNIQSLDLFLYNFIILQII